MKQFGRRFRLELGTASAGIEIDALRVAWDIKKTSDAKPNPGKIRVWNLSREHMNLLVSKQYTRARLFVGYSELRQIFVGDIIHASAVRDNLDFITELECGDGDAAYKNSHVSLSLAAGATDQQVFGELAKTMQGVGPGTAGFSRKRALPRGKVLSGNTRDHLGALAANHDAEWSIQDGELVMLPASQVLSDEAVVLSEDTGMIGSPEATDDGLEITSLVNPDLRIGGLVKVDSIVSAYNGVFKVTSIEYSGDLAGSEWFSKVTCVGGAFQKVKRDGE
ncbi:hypothetical protein SAMN02800692_1985 [Luteibacter sp. UNC138MFCol5.1]|uniref:phage protein n=1 Tax=Luteibacter sp. UNC138MFCol5.1 TaxID=1502774 RepID=UPI0008AD4E9F|nr:hypothetical protein [Luteibacter sp. UNC138MFCol5.1]SEO76230.1 hypothetical protein SAMN02800692_1985 [Luteibacter sp. UNC138MFCol5.1]